MSTTITRTVVRTIEVRVCACSTITARVPDASVLPKRHRAYVTDGVLSTGCEAETQRTFAPGHDARTAGLLAALHRADLPVVEQGVSVPALDWAERNLTDALVAKVAYEPKTREVPTVEVQTSSGEVVTVRIGRDGVAREVDADRTWKPGHFLVQSA